MTVRTHNYQQRFFEELGSRFPSKAAMIEAMGAQLHVGRDAIYRRLRGETILSAEEMIMLARKFGISLDPPSQDDIPSMYYPDGAQIITSEVQYFQLLLEQVKMITTLENARIDYATPELPLFYELYTPTLLAYKTYVYGLTSWNFEKWKNVPFSPQLIDPEVQKIATELMDVFFMLPGRELWSVGILDITLREIEHGVEVGYLQDWDVIEKMFEEVELNIRHMEEMTKVGKRFPPDGTWDENSPDFRVYHNELTNTNNVILVSSPLYSVVYTTFVNPNFLLSTDERIFNQMQIWFNNLVESSNVLNSDAGKYTTAYFNRLRKKLADTKLRVQVLSSLF